MFVAKVGLVRALLLALVITAAVVSAHPGEAPPTPQNIVEGKLYRRSAQAQYKRCNGSRQSLQRRHAVNTQVHRRQKLLEQLRRARTAQRRSDSGNASEVLETSHVSNRTDITSNSTTSAVFANSTDACVLQPEVTIGPYWVSGELLRSNLTDDQPGVPLYLDAQFVNINTCEPITDLYWEIWNCNSTGVYSGVVASGNGNMEDESNLNATFLRGVQRTDENGAAQFQTIFPGHYTGRAHHIHVVAHINATVLPNSTLANSANTGAVHIGQLFFDQDLISQVEASSPYSSNTQNITPNAEDSIFAQEADSEGSDPVLEYVLLSEKIEDGIFAWTSIAVDVDAKYNTSAAAAYTKDGGVANEQSLNGMGDGAPGGLAPSK
jgi:protocatechuate 3,4-dioxygenase beta subunit